MASYTIMNALGAGVTSSKFFQTGDGGSLLGSSSIAINPDFPDDLDTSGQSLRNCGIVSMG